MYTIGMDIGGTSTVFGIVDESGNIIASNSVKTQCYFKLDDYIDTVSNSIKQMMRSAQLTTCDIKGLGIGAPNGNYYRGTIEYAPNLPWKGIVIPLAELFRASLGGIPVTVTNDANAAALGEKKYGVAKDIDHFIMITLGTGVGSGIVIDGKLLYGHDGFAGELGHVIVRPEGRLCGCGRRGCLETYCSATGIAATARERLNETDMPSVLRSIRSEELTSKDIYSAAMMGDELAINIFNETGTILGEALADMVVFSNPEAIILFGGLAKAGDFILCPTQAAMEAKMLNVFKGKTRLLLSELKDADAAILGASALAW